MDGMIGSRNIHAHDLGLSRRIFALLANRWLATQTTDHGENRSEEMVAIVSSRPLPGKVAILNMAAMRLAFS